MKEEKLKRLETFSSIMLEIEIELDRIDRDVVNMVLSDDSLTEKQKYLEIFKLYLDKTIK